MTKMVVLAAALPNLSADWTSFWNMVSSASGMSGVIKLLGIIGVVLAVGSLVGWLWEIRRQGGFRGAARSHHKLIFGFLVGLILAGPGIVLPIFLTLFTQIINGLVSLLSSLP